MQATKAIQGFLRNSSGTASTFCFNLRVCATYAPDLFSQVLFFVVFEWPKKPPVQKYSSSPGCAPGCAPHIYIYICDLDTLCAGICATYIYIYIYICCLDVCCAPGCAPHIYIYIYMRFQDGAEGVIIFSKITYKNTWPYIYICVCVRVKKT